MKTLIAYSSVHHRNTKKIEETMADVLDAEVLMANYVDFARKLKS